MYKMYKQFDHLVHKSRCCFGCAASAHKSLDQLNACSQLNGVRRKSEEDVKGAKQPNNVKGAKQTPVLSVVRPALLC